MNKTAMSHTPGPWHMVTDGHKVGVLTTDNVRIICVCKYHLTTAQAVTDARLLAAAPDLLAALVGLLDWGRDNLSSVHNPEAHALLVAAHSVITKARGVAS